MENKREVVLSNKLKDF